jgi:hypothetical protein
MLSTPARLRLPTFQIAADLASGQLAVNASLAFLEREFSGRSRSARVIEATAHAQYTYANRVAKPAIYL